MAHSYSVQRYSAIINLSFMPGPLLSFQVLLSHGYCSDNKINGYSYNYIARLFIITTECYISLYYYNVLLVFIFLIP